MRGRPGAPPARRWRPFPIGEPVSQSPLPPWYHGPREPRGQRARRSLKQAALLLVGAVVVAASVGWLYGRGDAPGAARLLLEDRVETEALAEDGPGPEPERPTSGPARGAPVCDVRETAPSPTEQVATLAAGGVILHHRPDPDLGARLEALAEEHGKVAVVPGRDLDAPVVATAWRHRFAPDEVSVPDLERFILGWSDRGPDPRPCPDGSEPASR